MGHSALIFEFRNALSKLLKVYFIAFQFFLQKFHRTFFGSCYKANFIAITQRLHGTDTRKVGYLKTWRCRGASKVWRMG